VLPTLKAELLTRLALRRIANRSSNNITFSDYLCQQPFPIFTAESLYFTTCSPQFTGKVISFRHKILLCTECKNEYNKAKSGKDNKNI
jgi:hypothetical protein